jgi:uracil-DNA glycosylase
MAEKKRGSATPFIPEGADLAVLQEAVQHCRGCDLYRHATRAVFGAGSPEAALFLVGEKPGDREDLEGKPFVGPAGKMLHKGMEEAGLPPEKVYITNAVKHFKFTERGGKRLHKKPSGPEIAACRPWLEAELNLVKPKIVLCLGATAVQTLLGNRTRINQVRGKFMTHGSARTITATLHPSALLRIPEKETRREEYRRFVEDLKKVGEKLSEIK